MGFSNGISKVEAVSGAQRGDELFVDGELGAKGDRVEVPEFRISDSNSNAAQIYYTEYAFEVIAGWGDGCRNSVGKFATKEEAIRFAKFEAAKEPTMEFRVWTIDGDNSQSDFVAGKEQQ